MRATLQAMVDTQSLPLSNGLDVQKGMAKIVSDFGTASADAQNAAAFNKSMLQNLQDARNSVSGVSLDDEMVGLICRRSTPTKPWPRSSRPPGACSRP
jgi:flagellar hook-associated protein FlgK